MSKQKIKYSAINIVLALAIGGQVEAKKDGEKSFNTESKPVSVEVALEMEPWMFDELVPAEEIVSLEDWMFNELIPAEEVVSFEDWMFETEYFSMN